MKLSSISIKDLPGLKSELTINALNPGINFLSGSNGIGKSSIIRALRYIIVGAKKNDPLALSIKITLNDLASSKVFEVRRNGNEIVWEREGQYVDSLPLPNPSNLHSYWITLENLLKENIYDYQLIKELQKALFGGYDLTKLKDDLFKNVSYKKESSELNQAKKNQDTIEKEYNELREEEQQLPDLDEKIKNAKDAHNKIQKLEIAIELLNYLDEINDIENTLRQFPSNMKKLSGEEIVTLNRLENKCNELNESKIKVDSTYQNASENLKETGLEKNQPQDIYLENVKQLLSDAKKCELDIIEIDKDLTKSKTKEEIALFAIGGKKSIINFTPEQISEAEKFAKEFYELELEIKKINSKIIPIKNIPNTEELNQYSKGIQLLLKWLLSVRLERKNKKNLFRVAFATAILTTTLIGAFFQLLPLSISLLTLVGILGIAFFGIGAGIGLLPLLLSLKNNLSKEARDDFERLQIIENLYWDEQKVSKVLESLQKKYDEMRENYFSSFKNEQYENELTLLKNSLEILKNKKEGLRFDPKHTTLGFDYFVRMVNQYQISLQERLEIEEKIYKLKEKIKTNYQNIRKFLKNWFLDVNTDDGNELSTYLDKLIKNTKAAKEARGELKDAKKELQNYTKQIEDLNKEIKDLFNTVEVSDRAMLESNLSKLDSWKKHQERLRELATLQKKCIDNLSNETELMNLVENKERESLLKQKQCQEVVYNKKEFHEEQRIRIDERVKSAHSKEQLEEAIFCVNQKKEMLFEKFKQQMFAIAGQVLIEEIENEYHINHKPEILRKAIENFKKFTHYRYDIELDNINCQVKDVNLNTIHKLEELSSGTYIQLLLAIRLAHIHRLEQGCKSLPIFLDEILVTSDEARFKAITDVLLSLATDENRQIIYLSARHSEISMWEKIAGIKPHHINLDEIQDKNVKSLEKLDYTLAKTNPIPCPTNKSPEVYAKELNVTKFNPMKSPGKLHLFYLLRDDLHLLHNLMQNWKIFHLGQLENFLDSKVYHQKIHKSLTNISLSDRCLIAKTWVNYYCFGRNKYINISILKDSEIITENFIEPISKLVEKVKGCPKELIINLPKITKFRRENIHKIRNYLLNEGYITEDTPLESNERLQKILSELGERIVNQEIEKVINFIESAL